MKHQLKYIVLVMIFSLFACVDDVHVNIPVQKSSLVINSFFNPDSLWTVEVSKTISVASKSEKKLIAGAQVVLYANNNPIDTLIFTEDSTYQSVSKPQKEIFYSISAQADDYTQVEASGTLPQQAAEFNILSLEPTANLPAFLDENHVLKLEIDVSENSSQFFNLSIYILNENSMLCRVDSAFISNQTLLSNQDYGSGITFSKEIISLEDPLEVLVQNKYLQEGEFIIVLLKTISEDYYQYEVSLQQHLNTVGTPFSQPVSVFTNVLNGYGIFAGYQLSTDTLKID